MLRAACGRAAWVARATATLLAVAAWWVFVIGGAALHVTVAVDADGNPSRTGLYEERVGVLLARAGGGLAAALAAEISRAWAAGTLFSTPAAWLWAVLRHRLLGGGGGSGGSGGSDDANPARACASLGVSWPPNEAAVRTAHRAAARRLHPDRLPPTATEEEHVAAAAAFRTMQSAYESCHAAALRAAAGSGGGGGGGSRRRPPAFNDEL